MSKNKKSYRVEISEKYSQDFVVKASTKAEARRIAFERYKKRIKQYDFDIEVDIDVESFPFNLSRW